LDDVWSWSILALLSKVLGWAIGVGGPVLSDESNDHSGPETAHNASISLPSVDGEVFSSGNNVELFRENVKGWDNSSRHDDGGDSNLPFEGRLNVLNINGPAVNTKDGEEGSNNT